MSNVTTSEKVVAVAAVILIAVMTWVLVHFIVKFW